MHFRGSHSILYALNNILLSTTSSLYHLIHRAVAMSRKETLAEYISQVVKHLTLLVEICIAPRRLPL